MGSSFAQHVQNLLVQFPPFMMAVIFHEYAHGFMANRWGDPTAKDNGRLTLNPIPHIDPIGTLLFPMLNMVTGMHLLFGWANPVPINPTRFHKYRPGLFWVSFAGPGMNFLLATLAAAVCCALIRWMPEDFYLFVPLVKMTHVAVTLNFALGFFNLIPLPPLDGSKMVQAFLSYEATRKYEQLARYSFFILLALIMTNAISVLGYPILFASRLVMLTMARAFDVPEALFF